MRKVRFGIIGTNFITDWILEAAREELRFEATAVCSRSRETGQAFALKHGIPHLFTSPEEMAASSLINAVYIAVPNSLHAALSILFMQQGKHVLCEKPLASNAKEAREMIRVARQNGVTLMEAMKSTLTPNFRQLRRHLAEAGCLRRYFASYLGVYTVYPLVVLFGRPKRISATGLKLSTGVDGQGAVNFEYENLNATVLYSKIADSFLPAEIQGEKGTFILDRIQTIREVKFIPKGGQIQDLSVPASHNEYYYEIAEFIDLIERRLCESTINSHDHSLATLEIIDEVRKQSGIIYPADK